MKSPSKNSGGTSVKLAEVPVNCHVIKSEAANTECQSSSNGILPIAEAAKALRVKLPTLRDLRYHAQVRRNAKGEKVAGNGFASAFLKLGRSVYVDVDAFTTIWRNQASGGVE